MWHLSTVQFGDGLGQCMRDDSEKAVLLGELHRMHGIRVPDYPSHRQWHNSMSTEVKRGGFTACLKAAGPECYLFAGMVDGIGTVCVFVERSVRGGHFYPRITLVHLGFAEPVYHDIGTVLQGEFVRCASGRHVFAVSDALACCGRRLHANSFSHRLSAVRNNLLGGSMLRPVHATDVCTILVKTFFNPCRSIADVASNYLSRDAIAAGRLDFVANGIMFKSLVRNYYDPRSDILFKLHNVLPRIHHTQQQEQQEQQEEQEEQEEQDQQGEEQQQEPEEEEIVIREFHVRSTAIPDVYELHDTHQSMLDSPACGGNGQTIAGVPSLLASQALCRASKDSKPILFEYNAKFARWVPQASSLLQQADC